VLFVALFRFEEDARQRIIENLGFPVPKPEPTTVPQVTTTTTTATTTTTTTQDASQQQQQQQQVIYTNLFNDACFVFVILYLY